MVLTPRLVEEAVEPVMLVSMELISVIRVEIETTTVEILVSAAARVVFWVELKDMVLRLLWEILVAR